MFLKSLIPVGILFYFNTVYSSRSPEELYALYKRISSVLNAHYRLYGNICTYPKHKRANMCERIFMQIRVDNDEYKKSLHLNYLAFNHKEPCESINIRLSQENNRKVAQLAFSCFGRLAVVPSENTSHNQYLDEIKAFPLTESSIFIFKLVDQENKEYVLLDLLGRYFWRSIRNTSDNYFRMAIPTSITDHKDINKTLIPKCSNLLELRERCENILYGIRTPLFGYICNLVHRTSHIDFSQIKRQGMPSPEEVTITLTVPDELHFVGNSCRTYAYSCGDLFPKINHPTIANVKIAHGLKPTSILVLRRKENSENYECVEIINNISRLLLTRLERIGIESRKL